MKIKIFTIVFLVTSSISFSAPPEQKSVKPVNVRMLADAMAAHNSSICLGYEYLDGLNDTISDEAALARAKENWRSFAEVVSQQTDYEVEINHSNILIRPKAAPALYAAPIVTQQVRFKESPLTWANLGEAIKNIEFTDGSRKFRPDPWFEAISATEMTIKPDSDLLPTIQTMVDANKSGGVRLADLLFVLARSIGAKQWNYAPFDLLVNGEKPITPRKLRFSSLAFAGKLND